MSATSSPLPPEYPADYAAIVAERDQLRKSLQEAEGRHARLVEAYRAATEELALLKQRLFVAKAERVDTTQLQLEFEKKAEALDALKGQLPCEESDVPPIDTRRPAEKTPAPRKAPRGRRPVAELDLPLDRVEIPDPLFETLVSEGKATRTGFEESAQLAYKRGGLRRLIIARVKYEAVGRDGVREREVAAVPPSLVSRSLAAPSLLAHVITEKFCDGLPLFRIEERFGRVGVPIDRGTLARWVHGSGTGLGGVVVAMKKDAILRAFCIATDATGISIQPERHVPKPPRQPCRKGTFFTLVADKDHVLFEYMARETSAGVRDLLKGFKGYVQADAKSVYDAFFTERIESGEAPEGGPEVGCWVHGRRKFWEAAICKNAGGLEGLFRIRRLFQREATWTSRTPEERLRLRQEILKPEVDAFFEWAEAEYKRLEHVRGLARSAFGYVVRQKGPLSTFLANGRLIMDNNRAERSLRPIRVGQKAWLFIGSGDHAVSAAIHFSLVASARLHKLDPEAYLRDLIRVRPHWPDDRLLELSPKYWSLTRARLAPVQLAAEVGHLDVPEPLDTSGEPERTAPTQPA